ncbi:MAG: hypothetical protein HYV95_07310 [Opitutae bacterium]|nr:hypothetical protein [Opitutae bacterium]
MPSEIKQLGRQIGLHLGMRLWEDSILQTLPSSSRRASLDYVREFIGLFSLAENAAAAAVVLIYPTTATPQFRNELAEGLRTMAIIPDNPQIRIADILRTPVEHQHFSKIHSKQTLAELESLRSTPSEVDEALLLVQEMRAAEFGAALASAPIGILSGPVPAQKLGYGLVDCAHLWILGTTTKSEYSIALIDRITSALMPQVFATLEGYLKKA